jgi:hypothetical protein
MNPEKHREHLVDWFVNLFRRKYDNGEKEHGENGKLYEHGILWLLKNQTDEVLDHISYTGTLAYKLYQLSDVIDSALELSKAHPGCNRMVEPLEQRLNSISRKLEKAQELIGDGDF